MSEPTHQGTFYIIPTIIAEKGNSTKALLYGLISSLTNKEGYCFASNKYLATKLGKKDGSTISKYISELEKEGWIKTKVNKEYGNARKIWLLLGYKEIPIDYREKTEEVLGKNRRGLRKKPQTSSEKTEDNKISKKDKLKRKDIITPASAGAAVLKKSTLSLSSVSEKAETPNGPRGLTNLEKIVFDSYKKCIRMRCTEKTATIISGIPRAIAIFKPHFKTVDEAVGNLSEAIEQLSKSDWFRNTKKDNPIIFMPKLFFRKAFIENNLLNLILDNQHIHGSDSEDRFSEEELRGIAKANAERRRKIEERRAKRQQNNSGV